MNLSERLRRTAIAVLPLLVLAGCAAQSAYKHARQLADSEEWDQAVYYYAKALTLDPQNVEYRKALGLAKVKASQKHLELAKSYMAAGAVDLAIVEYRLAATLDPTNSYVADSLQNALEMKRQAVEQPSRQTDLERLKEETRGDVAGPILKPASEAPLTLNFPPNTKVKDIYLALGKAAGINVLFDSGIRDQETFSIDIANISFRKALDQVALANRHFYKVIDDRTIMVVPDNPQKRRDYEDHVIKTFYLSNANPNDVVNTLRGLLDARRIATNQSLNAITIRDTPAKISVMERVIEANDKPPSEVVIDVEILEVRKSNSLFYGSSLSSYQVQQTLEQPDEVNGIRGLRWSSLPFINASDWLLTVPDILYRAEKGQGDVRTLARPSLRALDGKQVTLRLGDQVPIETSTFSTGQVGNMPLTRNFQFRDIGTNIDITPRVHHNNEVTLQLQVEVTSVGSDPDGPSGPIPPTFGNRRIVTEIRLKDGETNLLAGLFTSTDEKARSGVPGLSDIPILNSIFASNSRQRTETDIVLTLTPHIVRTPNIKRADLEPFYVGTETNIGGVGDVGMASPFGGSPFTPPPDGGDDQGANPANPTDLAPAPIPPGFPSPGQPSQPFPGQPGSPFPQQDRQVPPRGQEPTPTSVRPAPVAVPPAPSEPPARAGQGTSPLATPTPVLAPALVSLAPASSTVAVGQDATIEVQIGGATEVGHAPFWIVYDPRVIEVTGVVEGPFLRSDGGSTVFHSSVPAAQPGDTSARVVVGLSRVGRNPGVSGSGVLATLQVRGKAQGTSPLQFTNASVRDAQSRPLPSSFTPGAVVVP